MKLLLLIKYSIFLKKSFLFSCIKLLQLIRLSNPDVTFCFKVEPCTVRIGLLSDKASKCVLPPDHDRNQ